MKKKLKTDIIITLFRFLNEAKYTKMNDADKITVWKILRALKPTAEKFEDDKKSCQEKLKPEGYDDLLKEAQKIENDERKDFGEINTPQREQEFVRFLCEKYENYANFQDVHRNMVKLCSEALQEFASKEVEVKYEPLTEDAFGKLMASNDWQLSKADFIGEYICK